MARKKKSGRSCIAFDATSVLHYTGVIPTPEEILDALLGCVTYGPDYNQPMNSGEVIYADGDFIITLDKGYYYLFVRNSIKWDVVDKYCRSYFEVYPSGSNIPCEKAGMFHTAREAVDYFQTVLAPGYYRVFKDGNRIGTLCVEGKE